MSVVMVSGGVDSFLATNLYPAAKLVFVDYGQKYAPLELRAVRELYGSRAIEVAIQGLAPLGSDYYVPARNMMLATIGLRFSSEICFAGMRDEQCPDKNEEAFSEMSRILTVHSKCPVRIFSPFWCFDKEDAVEQYLKSAPPEKLLRTVSCYEGKDEPCNDCEACFRRWTCLKVNGILDTSPSERIIREYGLGMLHAFPLQRQRSALRALQPDIQIFNLDDHQNVATIRSTAKYVAIHTHLPAGHRNRVKLLLEAEGVRYDAILTGWPRLTS